MEVKSRGLQKFREVQYKVADNYIRGDKRKVEKETRFSDLWDNRALSWLKICSVNNHSKRHTPLFTLISDSKERPNFSHKLPPSLFKP